MKEKIITKEEFIKTKWAGGETTQLTIYPEDANFSERDFLWRISSATFTGTESKFSDFSGYQRYILPLEGRLSVFHKGLYSRELDKFEVEYFDGSWETYSENSLDCRDYNFIVKNGSLAKMQILNNGDDYNIKASEVTTLFSTEDFMIELADAYIREIEGFSLLVLEIDQEERIKIRSAGAPIVLTEFSIDNKKIK
ncbi:HutD family protein [Gudongella sp. DL1XJH-153]|uniref:HutD family protein n=1 Tax=Gudongella sp. DL1XJH-153 TaxID=3409804 RepID=UPI003BB49FEC